MKAKKKEQAKVKAEIEEMNAQHYERMDGLLEILMSLKEGIDRYIAWTESRGVTNEVEK